VAAWIGSPNLGDELVFSALADQLRSRGMQPVALSVDPAATAADHGVAARRRRDVFLRGGGDGSTVLGGGGLLQDETSTLNLDLHLSPVVAARLRREPVVGVGLGAGRLSTRSGRLRVRAALAGVPLAVRDAGSADLLEAVGLPRPVVAADLTLSLPPPEVAPADRIVACLRPWSDRRHRLPARFRRHTVDDRFAAGAARSLDALSDSTGLPVHLVALDAPKDDPLHRSVAARMRSTTTLTCPNVHSVLDEVAASRLVVSMRYHGGMGAVLAGRPSILVGYTSKVESLAADIGPGAVGMRFSADGLGDLVGVAERVLDRGDDVVAARGRLAERERGNGAVLDRLVGMLDRRGRPRRP
jgi:polysaccharide pyruvyl transferase CsaB